MMVRKLRLHIFADLSHQFSASTVNTDDWPFGDTAIQTAIVINKLNMMVSQHMRHPQQELASTNGNTVCLPHARIDDFALNAVHQHQKVISSVATGRVQQPQNGHYVDMTHARAVLLDVCSRNALNGHVAQNALMLLQTLMTRSMPRMHDFETILYKVYLCLLIVCKKTHINFPMNEALSRLRLTRSDIENAANNVCHVLKIPMYTDLLKYGVDKASSLGLDEYHRELAYAIAQILSNDHGGSKSEMVPAIAVLNASLFQQEPVISTRKISNLYGVDENELKERAKKLGPYLPPGYRV